MKHIVVLGSTGSIGVNTLKVVTDFPERFKLVGLAAGDNHSLLAEQIRRFKPQVVSVRREEAAAKLRKEFKDIEINSGECGAVRTATWPKADLVVSAIVGAAGLVPTYAALEAGIDVALANKETLVMAGALIKPLLEDKGVNLIPIDSEHNAILQCLQGRPAGDVRKIILTASGGPFVDFTEAQLAEVTPRQALAHPTWSMGPKISLDSATLMNKGLEVIEAHWLFDLAPERIEVIIHPQSVIHSMVELLDGSVLAQLGITDMRLPILFALAYPERLENKLPGLQLSRVGNLTFKPPDSRRFPCLRLAYEAIKAGGSMPLVLNAANEVVGKAFLDNRISFNDIPALIEACMDNHQAERLHSISQVLTLDRLARAWVNNLILQTV